MGCAIYQTLILVKLPCKTCDLLMICGEKMIECAPLAQVAKLVDAPDLGSGAERCGGSSPFLGTKWLILKALKIH